MSSVNKVKLNFQQAIYGGTGSEASKAQATAYMLKHQKLSIMREEWNKHYSPENGYSGTICMGSGNLNSRIAIVFEVPMTSQQRNFYNKLMKVIGYETHRIFITSWFRSNTEGKTIDLGSDAYQQMLFKELNVIGTEIIIAVPQFDNSSWPSSELPKHEIIEFYNRKGIITCSFGTIISAPEKEQKRLKLTTLSDFKQVMPYYIRA